MAELQRSRSAAGRSALRCSTVASMEAARVSSWIIARQPRQAVLVRHHLALLGDLDGAVHGSPGLGQDRLGGRPAAEPDGAAAAVEEAQLHARFRGHLAQPARVAVQSPLCGGVQRGGAVDGGAGDGRVDGAGRPVAAAVSAGAALSCA